MKYIPLTGGAIAELSMHFVLCHARGQNSHIKVRVILSDSPLSFFSPHTSEKFNCVWLYGDTVPGMHHMSTDRGDLELELQDET